MSIETCAGMRVAKVLASACCYINRYFRQEAETILLFYKMASVGIVGLIQSSILLRGS